MGLRALVVAVFSAVVLVVPVAPAGAQVLPGNATWDEAAAFARFPVWRPERTLGLRASVGTRNCEFGDVPQLVGARYRKKGSRKQLSLVEQIAGFSCGNPEVWDDFRTVRIGGQRALVRRAPTGEALAADLVQPARRWHGGTRRRTSIHAVSLHLKLREFVRMLRSLRVVDVRRPTVDLSSFLSSDGSVWCGIGIEDDERWCSTRDPQYGANLYPDGALRLCGAAQSDPAAQLCLQNWDVDAFRLADGQSSDAGAFLCTDQAGAVTCTVKRGDAAGSGFRVSVSGSEAVEGPAAVAR